MNLKRALVRPQEGMFCKPIGRLFKAKRPYVALQKVWKYFTHSNKHKSKLILEDEKYSYENILHYQSVQLSFCLFFLYYHLKLHGHIISVHKDDIFYQSTWRRHLIYNNFRVDFILYNVNFFHDIIMLINRNFCFVDKYYIFAYN